MIVYYLRRRSGDIAMADLRKVDAYTENSEDIFFNMSSPIKEREYDAAAESLMKGINKKIIQKVREKHGLSMLLISVFITFTIMLSIELSSFTLSIGNYALLLACVIIGATFISSGIYKNTRDVRKTRESYLKEINDPVLIYTEEMERLEEYYASLYDYDLKTLASHLAEGTLVPFDGNIPIGFLLALECYILDCNKHVHNYADTLLGTKTYNPENEKEHIQNDTATGLLDIHLLAFFVGINKNSRI